MQCAGNAIEGAAGIEWNVIGNSRNVHNGFFVLFVCLLFFCLFVSLSKVGFEFKKIFCVIISNPIFFHHYSIGEINDY